MKLLQRLKIAWGLLFSSKYIDEKELEIQRLRDRVYRFSSDFVRASERFRNTLSLLNLSEKHAFLGNVSGLAFTQIKVNIPKINTNIDLIDATFPPAYYHPDYLFIREIKAYKLIDYCDALDDHINRAAEQIARDLIANGVIKVVADESGYHAVVYVYKPE